MRSAVPAHVRMYVVNVQVIAPEVRRGDVEAMDVMSWVGNYSDCAFGSHSPGQRSLNQEDMSRSTETDRCTGQLVLLQTKNVAKEKKTQDYTEQKRQACCLKSSFLIL